MTKTSVSFVVSAMRACIQVRKSFPVSKRTAKKSGKQAERAIEHFNSLSFEERCAFITAAFTLCDFVTHVTDDIDDLEIKVNLLTK